MTKKSNISWLPLPVSRRQMLAGSAAAALTSLLPFGSATAAGSTLRVRSYSDMRTMDPALSQGVVDEEIHSLTYSKLIQYKPGKGWGWEKDAAAEIKQVDDTHINFALRDDVGFNNGFGSMTAEDVKYSFERILDPKVESSNKPDMDSLDHVDVTGERTGTIVLKKPFQPLWSIALPYITGNIVSKAAFEQAGGTITTKEVAASGPYSQESWTAKQKSVLTKNPAWKGRKQAFDKVEFYPIDDEKAAEIAFEAGELEFTRVSLGSLERLKASPPANSTIAEFPSLYYVWMGMNLDHPKLQNIKLRQAIQYAIDVPSIMQAAYYGIAQPSTGIIAPGLVGHRRKNLTGETANTSKAKKLLAESGEKNVSLALTVINKEVSVTTAQVIQANLKAIGIDLEIKTEEAATFWDSGSNEDLQLILNRFSMLPDPYYATAWFTCEQAGVWNWERFCEEEFDNIHNTASSVSDDKKRGKMYRRAQDMMEESGAYKFLTHEATPNIYSNSVKPAFRPDGLPLYRYFKRA